MNNHSIQDLTANILSYLGQPTVNIELTQQQINFAISEQARLLSRYYPTMRYMNIPIQLGTAQYNLLDPENRAVQTVVEVIRMNPNTVFYNTIKIDPLLHPYDIDDFIEITQLINMRRKFLNMDTTFDFDVNTQILTLYPVISQGEWMISVLYTLEPYLNEITEFNYRWMQRYQTQVSKEMLGRVRGKYSGVNTPIGQVTLDADRLLSEQEAEKTKLEEELTARQTADIIKYAKFVG